jgi:hypothetical protein
MEPHFVGPSLRPSKPAVRRTAPPHFLPWNPAAPANPGCWSLPSAWDAYHCSLVLAGYRLGVVHCGSSLITRKIYGLTELAYTIQRAMARHGFTPAEVSINISAITSKCRPMTIIDTPTPNYLTFDRLPTPLSGYHSTWRQTDATRRHGKADWHKIAQAHRRFEAVIPLAGYKVTTADYSPSVIVLARLTRYQDSADALAIARAINLGMTPAEIAALLALRQAPEC